MKCIRCGNQLPDNARVCGKCGQTVAKKPAVQKSSTPPASQPPKASYPPKYSAPKAQPDKQTHFNVQIPQKAPKQTKSASPEYVRKKSADQPVPGNRSGNPRRLTNILLIVLIIAVVGFGGLMLRAMHRDNVQTSNPERISANHPEESPLSTEKDIPFAAKEEPVQNETEAVAEPTENAEVKPTGNFSSTYITDGGEYDIAVGDSFTMYHPRTPTSPYYAYTWIVESGEDCVEMDRDQGTCNVIGIKPGTVKLSANLDYSVLSGYSSQSYSYEYEITIHVKEAGNYDHGDVTDGLCPRCHGSRTVDCTVCYGDGKLSTGTICDNCSNGKVTCHYCNGSGTWN